MNTAAIAYRVADFLKQHPPFEFMEVPDLVALAARGRVKFHESDEYICWQSAAHTPFFFVIQQGSVSLWDESVNPPVLRDIRGAGDSIGLERFNGIPTSLVSAKAASDVVLYALHAADFEPLLQRHPRAKKFVIAYSAVTADYEPPGERSYPHQTFLSDLLRDRAPLHCSGSTPIQDAARLLHDSGAQAIALTEDGAFSAILTSADLLRWVAAGASNPRQPASNIANADPITVAPNTLVSDCVLAMAQSGTHAAALTNDGSPGSTLERIITIPSLTQAFGDHPVAILREIVSAPTVESLRILNERARSWILDNLSAPSAAGWLASFSDFVNRGIIRRLLDLQGLDSSRLSWCFCGSAGRQELLTAAAPSIAIIGAGTPAASLALADCGYHSPDTLALDSLDEWKSRFSGWIRDPIRTQMYRARPLFDLRLFHGPGQPFGELEAHIRRELAAEPGFLQLLANDCLANLPPLTFFRDVVVEESGELTDTFRLESNAVQPLADVARVFSLAAGIPLGASTTARFEAAGRLLPAQSDLFREAADTMSVMLFHQARAGLRLRSNGAELPLPLLSRHDRQVIKSGFRSIHRLLEFAASWEWLEAV
ncbi:putative nucleotidyltransferase substrate binding domain-containing protein [Paludibaculum fermentans]|uniref:putative nucleotidyltransferase substrate binding domain-containing protein n=1 Tax=Paludibaculum fermentans TaxID=1473598 RepID=UPI003EBDA4F8